MGALEPRLDGTGVKAPPPLLQGVYYSINILAEGVQSVQRDANSGTDALKDGSLIACAAAVASLEEARNGHDTG